MSGNLGSRITINSFLFPDMHAFVSILLFFKKTCFGRRLVDFIILLVDVLLFCLPAGGTTHLIQVLSKVQMCDFLTSKKGALGL